MPAFPDNASTENPTSQAADGTPLLDRRTIILFTLGYGGTAIKRSGLAAFLLLYYDQVVGLSAAVIGGVLSLILILDALIDPIVGRMSDDFRSRWGRRHPFMYLSILPVSIGFTLLWMAPTGWSDTALLAYMVSIVVLVRIFDTFFELPASALVAELTQDYDRRTLIVSWRMVFAAAGALGMKSLAFSWILSDSGNGATVSQAGFTTYALTSGILIFVTMLISTLSTHKFIPHLTVPVKESFRLGRILKEMLNALANRSWAAVAIGGALMNTCKGAILGLAAYVYIFFWQLSGSQIAFIITADLIASVVGALIAARAGRWLGKRNAAIAGIVVTFFCFATPVTLGFAGLMPARGSQELVAVLYAALLFQECGSMIANVMLSAMILDLVEATEVRTGKRSEGVLISGDSLINKVVAGGGVFVSGLILTVANFPKGAKAGEVPEAVTNMLALSLVAGLAIAFAFAVLALLFYRITRADHDRNVELLRERAAAA